MKKKEMMTKRSERWPRCDLFMKVCFAMRWLPNDYGRLGDVLCVFVRVVAQFEPGDIEDDERVSICVWIVWRGCDMSKECSTLGWPLSSICYSKGRRDAGADG